MYKRILMPTDGSALSEEAIRQGLELTAALGASATFLYVLESPMTLYQTPESISYLPQLYDDLRETGDQALARASELAEEAGVTYDVRLIEDSNPVDAISTLEQDYDLVIMGTHGRSGFNRWMFGSVAEGALRRATKPFLLIRHEEKTADTTSAAKS
jgi:nucleotide-binding universal stress UspA family protein